MLEAVRQILRVEGWQVVVELAVIWLCVYQVARFLRGTRGAGAFRGFIVLVVLATLLIRVVGDAAGIFPRLGFIYERFLGLAAVFLIVVFQQELRQGMMRLGHSLRFGADAGSDRAIVDPIADAVEYLAKNHFGALIAIERRTRLGELVAGGVTLDALLESRLLQSIFYPNSALHDLGVVVRGDRILAAGVQFPLAPEGVLDPSFGSRHRAGLGLSLDADSLVVIVSEETGSVSFAEAGRLEHDVPRDQFRSRLAERLTGAPPEPTPATAVTVDAPEKPTAAA